MSTKELAGRLRGVSAENSPAKSALRAVAIAVFFMLLSNVTALGFFTPLGVACAAISGGAGVFAVVGALLGYVLFYTPNSALYCAAIFLSVIVRAIITRKSPRTAERIMPLISSAAALLCGLPRVIGDLSAYAALALVCEALTVGAASLTVSRVYATLFDKSRNYPTDHERALVCCALGAALCGLSQMTGLTYNPVNAVIFLFIMWTGLSGGLTVSAAAGVTCGVIMSMSGGTLFFLPMCTLSALTSALLKKSGKTAAVTASLVCCGISLSLAGVDDSSLMRTLELLTACAAILVIPEGVQLRLQSALFMARTDDAADKRAAQRLYNAGIGLKESADCIAAVSDKLKSVNSRDIAWVYEASADAVCARCGLKNSCWNKKYTHTLDEMGKLTPLLYKHGRVKADDFTVDFAAECPKTDEMTAMINRKYSEFLLKSSTDDYAFMMRGMLASQFKELGDIILKMSDEIGSGSTLDRAAAMRLRDVFYNDGFEAFDCVCLLDSRRRMTAQATVKDIAVADAEKILPMIEHALGRRFRKPSAESVKDGVKLCYRERTEYSIQTASCSKSMAGERVCGDERAVFFYEGWGICLLCDGMGSGSLAAVESKMAVTLLKRLITAGFSFEGALSAVNWSLSVKGGDERLSTADMLAVDLYSGEAKFYKAGAAPSFLLHNGQAREITFSSMPLGILMGTAADCRGVKLCGGDTVVMVSDGALYDENDWIMREMKNHKGDLSELANDLLTRAKARRPSDEDDDATVICVRISKV